MKNSPNSNFAIQVRGLSHFSLSRLAALGAVFLIIGCGAKDADKIGDAQICLDKATTASQADTCMSKVDGIETSSAYGIRCSAKFIAEGFGSPSRIVDVFSSLDGGGDVNDLMSLITFTAKGSITADTTSAADTFQYCYNSGGKGSTLLVSFSNIAMSLYNFIATIGGAPGSCASTPSGSPSKYDFANCLSATVTQCIATPGSAFCTSFDDINDTTASASAGAQSVQNAIGTTVITTHRLSCSSGTGANATLCSEFDRAISDAGGTSNPRRVAVELIQNLVSLL